MDFSFTDEQEAVRSLAAQVFEGSSPPERVKEVEASDERFDRKLWEELATTGLLGIGVPEAHGGAGLGMVEVALVLEEQGRRVAPVPLWSTVVAAMAIAELGRDEVKERWLPAVAGGDAVLTFALEPPGPGVWPSVPALPFADAVLVPTDDGLVLVEPDDDRVEPCETTSRARYGHLHLDEVTGTPLGGDRSWLLERALVGLAATQVGVGEEATRLAAEYASQREQFGRPLSTNQGVVLKAADAYIALAAMRATLWQAAWRLDQGLDAARAAEVAHWWASDGGHRVVHVTQHLHGGMGADIDYPVHRYFLWGKHTCDLLGGPSAHLARLGDLIAERAKA
jgi:acyl-CoA dehydrogenase